MPKKPRINDRDIAVMSVKERMLYYIESHRYSKMDFYEISGLNPSLFTKSTLKSDCLSATVASFKRYYDSASLEWILLGKGEMDEAEISEDLINMYKQRAAEKDEFISLLKDINDENKERIVELKDMILLLKQIKKG